MEFLVIEGKADVDWVEVALHDFWCFCGCLRCIRNRNGIRFLNVSHLRVLLRLLISRLVQVTKSGNGYWTLVLANLWRILDC
jgi:hypothetical protein